mgnify:FL=1
MNERFLGIAHSVRRFIGIRSDQEVLTATMAAEDGLRNLVAQQLSGSITPEEFEKGFEKYLRNPDARLDLRRAGQKLRNP